jgi:hypothetical protein
MIQRAGLIATVKLDPVQPQQAGFPRLARHVGRDPVIGRGQEVETGRRI